MRMPPTRKTPAQTIDTAAAWLAALAHPARLRMVLGLRRSTCNVQALWQELGISQPLASQHLKKLRQAGLVEARKLGQARCYRISDRRLLKLLTLLGL
jgi:ArsR family transcriptional regulator, zinc-responsive transcriptional repressor